MIALGSDHAGYDLKQTLIKYFNEKKIPYKDVGCYTEEACDYPEYAKKLCKLIKNGECEKGVLLCGTGIGISITANRIPGIRAALCHDCVSAYSARTHNDANILVLGGRIIGCAHALEITKIFLETDFSNEERHIKRIEQIEKEGSY